MAIRVSHPNGSTVEFPDGTDSGTIMQALKQLEAPATVPEKPKLSELDQRMSDRVAKESAGGFAPHPSPVQYLPFGSFLDEASAGIDAGLNIVSGGSFGQPYSEAKAYQDARQRYIDENASGLERGAAMAGGIAASIPTTPAINLFRGGAMLPSIGNAAVTGGVYGGVYGAGEGEGTERLVNAAKGTAIGAGTGAAVVPVARGVGNAINYARNRMAPLPAPLNALERGAVNRVADDIQSSGLTGARYQQQARELGNEGMLLDMGEDLRGSAETLANTQGPQLPVIRGQLNARREDAPGRINDAIERYVGPEQNLPALITNLRRQYGQQAAPYYDAFYASQIEQTPELRRTLSQIPAAAFRKAEQLARADGVRQRFRLRPVNDPMTPITGVQGSRAERVHQGVEYDYLKRAVDDLSRGADPGSNEQRVFSNLARNLRNQVDEILSPGAPDQSPWAQGRQIAGEGIEGREAVEAGGRIFSSKRDPHIVEDDLQGMSALGRQLYRYGARNDLRQIMGRGATNFGPRGDNTARRALNSEFARENVARVAGAGNAERLTNVVDAENRMADSFNMIMQNSATARRQAGQTRLPAGAGAPIRTEAPRTIGEAAYSIVRRGVNALLNNALGERAGRIMSDQARLLTARGIDRDTYVQALLRLANNRQTTAQQRDVIIQMLNAVGQQARVPLIESQTAQPASP